MKSIQKYLALSWKHYKLRENPIINSRLSTWLVLFSLFPTIGLADIYMRVDADGNAYYSDVPIKEGKTVTLPPLSVTHSSALKTAAASEQPTVKIESTNKPEANTQPQNNPENPPVPTISNSDTYKTFLITSPTNGQTFQNQRDLTITVSIDPDLRESDKIQMLVDGQPLGDPQSSTSFNFYNLDRGAHTFQAALYNADHQQIKKSNSVLVYIHYASVNTTLLKKIAETISGVTL